MLKWEISLRYWFHILWIYIHKWDYWIKGYLYFSYFEENPVFSQNGCTDLHFQMFVDEWIEKMWLYIWLHTHIHTHTHTYTHSGLLISLKKKEGDPVICDNRMNLINMISEISQIQKSKYCIFSIIGGIWNVNFIKTESSTVVIIS